MLCEKLFSHIFIAIIFQHAIPRIKLRFKKIVPATAEEPIGVFSLLGREPTDVVLGLPDPLPILALFSRKLFLNLEAKPELDPLRPSEFLRVCFVLPKL